MSMPDKPKRPVAVALRYDANRENAPRVVAKGVGETADKIVEAAKAAGVPLREDAAMAETLVMLELDAIVPPELFTAMAAVIAWAYKQDKKRSTPPKSKPAAGRAASRRY